MIFFKEVADEKIIFQMIGNGKPLFKGFNDRLKLTLVETRTFQSGSVFLGYLPESYNAIKGDQP